MSRLLFGFLYFFAGLLDVIDDPAVQIVLNAAYGAQVLRLVFVISKEKVVIVLGRALNKHLRILVSHLLSFVFMVPFKITLK